MKLQTVIKIRNLNNNDDNNREIEPKRENIVIKIFKNVIN